MWKVSVRRELKKQGWHKITTYINSDFIFLKPKYQFSAHTTTEFTKHLKTRYCIKIPHYKTRFCIDIQSHVVKQTQCLEPFTKMLTDISGPFRIKWVHKLCPGLKLYLSLGLDDVICVPKLFSWGFAFRVRPERSFSAWTMPRVLRRRWIMLGVVWVYHVQHKGVYMETCGTHCVAGMYMELMCVKRLAWPWARSYCWRNGYSREALTCKHCVSGIRMGGIVHPPANSQIILKRFCAVAIRVAR